MQRPARSGIVTPEAVPLNVDVAGLGSRMIALIIDTVIQAGLLVLVTLAFAAAHRIVDAIPGTYAVGAVAVLVTGRSQRLGDLAAGTMVIRERKASVPVPLDLSPAGGDVDAGRMVDPVALEEQDYALVRSFLQRRASLSPPVRAHLASQVAAAIRARTGVAAREDIDDERFLEAVAVAYRDRFGPPHRGPDGRPRL